MISSSENLQKQICFYLWLILPKSSVFLQFHLTKRMTFMSKFMKLHSHVLCFLNQKTKIHVNFANVLWVAFSVPSGSLSFVKYPVYVCRHWGKKVACLNTLTLILFYPFPTPCRYFFVFVPTMYNSFVICRIFLRRRLPWRLNNIQQEAH
jgi:hypothetical protein